MSNVNVPAVPKSGGIPGIPSLPGVNLGPLLAPLVASAGEQIITLLVGTLAALLARAMAPKAPPAVDVTAPPAPPVVVDGGTVTIPQVPINVKARVASIRTVVQGVEKPQRVGGGPGVNYEDFQARIANGEAFNFGCVAFLDSTAFDSDGDEFTGGSRGKLVANDLEFRGSYRVYRHGDLVAFIEGAGDDNPTGEGKPMPWHQSDSGFVNFGQGKWMATASMGVRIVFREEGDYEIEFELDGVKSSRIPFRVS